MTTYECSCTPTTISENPYCPLCGGRPEQPPVVRTVSNRTVNAFDGVAAGGDISVGGNLSIGRQQDNVVETIMTRKRTRRPILADNWATSIAAVCTVLSFACARFATPDWPLAVGPSMMFLGTVGICFCGYALWIRFLMPKNKPTPSLFDPGLLYERTDENGLEASTIVANCPMCARGSHPSQMALSRVHRNGSSGPREVRWVCRRYPKHWLEFDASLIVESE